ncbi:phosphoribosylanthranilate isomerase [Leadbetterella byssophila]|uniref:N-(5'-phosphoribosyl)anthranilate isomerase n=1 Tax=Leadbetterella byssophila (strain DSM 17132 / JCM 16389 / KACC 11308 / NBRC 106382 / 4M15) TaxID=649349 RepID=E4RX22_LEAB4|nr:phosphoribosylanthranilate isomerase [Leadbetterella byssophila]ADQ18061.1 Phosphoribosylanthranilate isomerase [Leadbetterella byssophila DSM 17132]
MKIKVCGMRDRENILALESLKPDMMGLIFYPKSPRFVQNSIPDISVPKVGVFVHASFEEIKAKVEEYALAYVQLHSEETPELAERVKSLGVGVIKAFGVDGDLDFSKLEEFEGSVDYFLFDTKGDQYGGHGKAFDWSILNKYQGKTPYLIAGGIDLENIDQLLSLKLSGWKGIDVNSRFELSPAIKDIQALEKLFNKVRNLAQA